MFFVCIHPVYLDGSAKDASINHLHTKNALQKAKMARNIKVDLKEHETTVESRITEGRSKPPLSNRESA